MSITTSIYIGIHPLDFVEILGVNARVAARLDAAYRRHMRQFIANLTTIESDAAVCAFDDEKFEIFYLCGEPLFDEDVDIRARVEEEMCRLVPSGDPDDLARELKAIYDEAMADDDDEDDDEEEEEAA